MPNIIKAEPDENIFTCSLEDLPTTWQAIACLADLSEGEWAKLPIGVRTWYNHVVAEIAEFYAELRTAAEAE